MTIYNDVFGGANIYPSEISYSSFDLTANVALSWPEETSTAGDFATRIIDVSTLLDGLVMTLPPANGSGVGETIMFNNVGAKDVIVSDYTGTQVLSLASGTVWQVYITNNSTQAGTWVALQYGASATSANASALAGTGIVAVGTMLSQSIPITTFNTDYSAGINDRAKMLVWQAGSGTLTLPTAESVGDNWFILLRNAGSGSLLIDPSGSATIDGSSTLSYQPGESSTIVSDGTNYYTMGFGQSADFAFDYTAVDLTAQTSYTLSGSELNRIAYSFFGALSADCDVIVPATVQQYWVTNNTTGGFIVQTKTSAGTGISLAIGESAILYSNGIDVVLADTSGISLPLSVSQGGTGATSASGARVNLGGTSVGIAVFTAASTNAAWAALGNSPLVSGGAF